MSTNNLNLELKAIKRNKKYYECYTFKEGLEWVEKKILKGEEE